MPSPHVRPLLRPLGVSLFVLITAAVAACGGKDPYAPVASYPNLPTAFVVFPLRNSPPPQAPAVDLRTGTPVRPAITYSATSGLLVPNFDFAIDVDAAGHILLLPPRLVAAAQLVPRTGFQVTSTAYDSLGAAPGGAYQDSVQQVVPGQTVVVQAQGTTGCTVGSPFYAKLVVDRVDPVTGAIYVRATIDPNCGFKSFAAGLPTS